MRTPLIMAAGSAAGLLMLAGAGPAVASCGSSEATGTILGGVGGALIGGAVGHTGGAVIGGLGGAVVGHEIGRSSCRHSHYAYYRYYRRRPAYGYDYGYRYGSAYAPAPPPPDIYYDPYGQPLRVSAGAPPAPLPVPAYGACRTEEQDFYDPSGTLVRQQVPVCDR